MVHRAAGHLQDDAHIINKAGLVRGSIQRISKLVLINPHRVTQEDLNEIGDQLAYFIQLEDLYLARKQHVLSFEGVGELELKWRLLREGLEDYQRFPTMDRWQLILELSESCWNSADGMVDIALKSSDKRVNNIRLALYLMFLLLAVTVVLVIAGLVFYVTRKLERETVRDHLTGAHNRRRFDEVMDQELERCNRYGTALSLILIDLDHFKQVNDNFGHKVGDQVLIEFTHLLKGAHRKTDRFYRLGGEEFALVCPGADFVAATGLANKLCKLVSGHKFPLDKQVTASFGVAQYDNGDTVDALYHQADLALYAAKGNGRNRVELYDESFESGHP